MIDVVIAGAGPNGLMLASELALAGIRQVVLDPMPGPNRNPRVNRIVGQAARILDHRGLYGAPIPGVLYLLLTDTIDEEGHRVIRQVLLLHLALGLLLDFLHRDGRASAKESAPNARGAHRGVH